MELFTIVTALLGSIVAFGLLAVTNGADSRDSMADDWTRATTA
jgi:hypothetical protein